MLRQYAKRSSRLKASFKLLPLKWARIPNIGVCWIFQARQLQVAFGNKDIYYV